MGNRVLRGAAKGSRTSAGHEKDITVGRVGPVTIYRRGKTEYLYYRCRKLPLDKSDVQN